MNAKAEALRSDVLALPEDERAGLTLDLLDSLDDRPVEDDQTEVDRIWAEETARRAVQIDSSARFVPPPTVLRDGPTQVPRPARTPPPAVLGRPRHERLIGADDSR